MKEMMKKVKERREGFTMAELLIVVAIIAVLVAIAIPVFTAQLDKSKAATDAANIRSGYAAVQTEALTGGVASSGATYTLNKDGSVVAGTAGDYKTAGKSADVEHGTTIGGLTISGTSSGAVVYWTSGQTITYDVDSAGKVVKIH